MAVGVLELLRDQLNLVVHHRIERGLGQLGHAHPPLQRQAGLDHGAGALARSHGGSVVLGFSQETAGFEVFGDLLAGGKALHAGVLKAVGAEGSVFVQHVEHLEAVLLADGVVVPVVGRSHFEAAGSEIGRDVVVEDDGHFASADRNPHVHAVQCCVALVLGVDGHRHVAHDRLGARGGHG